MTKPLEQFKHCTTKKRMVNCCKQKEQLDIGQCIKIGAKKSADNT